MPEPKKWWKDAVVYQIYPAGFKDSDGDGHGDIKGIISKLDYIKNIGVDTLWICPMYDSPQLRKGIDGFRIDAVNMYSKPPNFPDAPILDKPKEYQWPGNYYCNGPRIHELLREMNFIFKKYNAMTVGELPGTPDPAMIHKYISSAEHQLDMVFQFDLMYVGFDKTNKFGTRPHNFTLPTVKRAIKAPQHLTADSDAWTTSFTEHHDSSRSISRFASDAMGWLGVNAAKQDRDEWSVLEMWRRMLTLRRKYRELFMRGHFKIYDEENLDSFMFEKAHGDQKALVVFNFSNREVKFLKPKVVDGSLELLVASMVDTKIV
ncbi:glycoside hydrolase family 13 protein [Patellaria atrata CBS 101060]|uniref:Glycoside hydrolase family 13 protein n=1 Tax=Patellaria atrata CBS 101060 TaxID=1346257 RepID=A0A9P4S386_9PEZI|nr:glycoside hydrolase family 13 protein [Patellaria atrata CBS 101060]